MIGLRRDDIPCSRRSAMSACASGARQGPGRNVRRSRMIVSRRTAPPNDSGIQRAARSTSRPVCGTNGTIAQKTGSVAPLQLLLRLLPDDGRRASYAPRHGVFCTTWVDGWHCAFRHVGCRSKDAIPPVGTSDLLPQKRNMHLREHLFNTDSIIGCRLRERPPGGGGSRTLWIAACATAGRMSHIGLCHRRGTCPWHSAS